MSHKLEPLWCDWPCPEYARDMHDLARMGIRCDAWRDFFDSRTLKRLKRLRGYVAWFNRYEYFDKLIVAFKSQPARIARALEGMMLPERRVPVVFTRNDIYDSRAWFSATLDHFLPLATLRPRAVDTFWQHEVLSRHQVPLLQFGVDVPWLVSRNCFTLRHRIKHGKRAAVLTFSHPDLEPRFKNERWCAEGTFGIEATRAEMFAALMGQTEETAKRHLVTIT